MEIGSIITFVYPAVHQQGTRAHDKNPKVLVLHDNWQGLVHGLNFNYLSPDEINMVRMLMDPKFEEQHKASLTRTNPYIVQEFDRIMQEVGNTTITSPHDFYTRAIRPFISKRGYDPYRLYTPSKMTNIKILETRKIMTGDELSQSKLDMYAKQFGRFLGPRLPNRFRR